MGPSRTITSTICLILVHASENVRVPSAIWGEDSQSIVFHPIGSY
jgi:hypothetical protein